MEVIGDGTLKRDTAEAQATDLRKGVSPTSISRVGRSANSCRRGAHNGAAAAGGSVTTVLVVSLAPAIQPPAAAPTRRSPGP